MAVAVVATRIDNAAAANSDHGLGLLDTILATDPTLLCSYIRCQEPVSSESCPDNTTYIERTAQFGCCGSCLAFRQSAESCTGDIDSHTSEGYTKDRNFLLSLNITSDKNVVQSSLCDYGLICNAGSCIVDPRTETVCKSMLDHYLTDLQTPGAYLHYRDDYRWKPVCTQDGYFDAKQCIGPLDSQRCVCVDPDGNRLFGKAFPLQEELFNTMNCKCSRQVWEKQQAGESPITLHCLENGNFEPLQCEDGWCYCVDPTTAEVYGSRLPEIAMHMLPCYNKTTTGEQYLRRCDSEYYAHVKLVDGLAASGTKGPQGSSSCDEDGSYTSEQCGSYGCRCYDKYYSQSYGLSGGDCQCIDDTRYYEEIGSNINPSCEVETGIYTSEQVVGMYKFCVDEDGIRSGPLVMDSDDYTLDCDNARLCQENGAEENVVGINPCENTCYVTGGVCPMEAYAANNA